MTTETIDLDLRRGMAAQKATDLRRLLSEVEANQDQLGHYKSTELPPLVSPPKKFDFS